MALWMLFLLLILLRTRRTRLKVEIDLQLNPRGADVATRWLAQHQYDTDHAIFC